MVTPSPRIAVVIPCYRVSRSIADLIIAIGPEVATIYVIDDACPEKSGELVKNTSVDPRVKVISHTENQGVGGAVVSGYRAALADGMEIIVKLDGDGQMDPSLIPNFTGPIARGEADYAKGNRFFNLEDVRSMPKERLLGNAALSFLTKLSSGYWDLFDPTNGYTAIHRDVAKALPLEKLSRGYFFESDLLFRLNILRAVVVDVPMAAKYGDETSSLKISKIISEFLLKHLGNLGKRIFYNYFLRDMSIASLELPLGLIMLLVGSVIGFSHWGDSLRTGIPTPAGTVMLSGLNIIIGMQFVLAFLAYDIGSVPRRPIHRGKRP